MTRVLVSAYACSPGFGSEQGVGWNRVRQMARFSETWCITREKHRAAIEAAIAQEPLPNVHWVYHDLPRWARFWKKGRRGMYPYYALWQATAYLKARKLHRQAPFDCVHHVTFVNYWLPSFVAFLPASCFVWGPVGGADAPPLSFWRCYRWRGKIFEALRAVVQHVCERNPLLRLCARRATVALATTRETEVRLRSLGCGNVLVYSEAGLEEDEISRLASIPWQHDGPFRLVSVGDLLHLKGFQLGIRAFAKFHSRFRDSEYWIIGNGPEERSLRELAIDLGVSDSVVFCGRVPRSEVLQRLAQCDVLVHPTLHDSGGWVCLEAMSAGRPVLCLDLGGPGLQVTPETGIKIPARSPDQAIADLDDAMLRLAEDPSLRIRMGQAGRKRIREHFSWDVKGDWLNQVGSQMQTSGDECGEVEGFENAR